MKVFNIVKYVCRVLSGFPQHNDKHHEVAIDDDSAGIEKQGNHIIKIPSSHDNIKTNLFKRERKKSS